MMEIQHAGLGAAYLRAHPDVPAVHDLNEPCAYCAGNTFDLDAIRARDAAADNTPIDSLRWRQVAADRRALLAEVDRLTRETERRLQEEREYQWGMAEMNLDGAVSAERARIRAAVEGLRTWTDAYPPRVMVVDRAAVLAAIDGETP